MFVDPSGARPRWTRRAFAVLTIPLGGFLVVTAAGFHNAGLAGGTWGLPDLPILSSEDERGPGDGSSVGSDDEDVDDGRLMTAAVTVARPYVMRIEPDLPAFLAPVDVPAAGDEVSLADAGGDEATDQASAPLPAPQQTPPAPAPVPPGSSPSGSPSAAPPPGPTTDPTTPPTSEPAPEAPADPDPDPDGSDETGDAGTGEGGELAAIARSPG